MGVLKPMLNKTIVIYTADVYLDVILAGDSLPTSQEIAFPFDDNSDEFFRFGIGLMEDHNTNDPPTFHEIGQIDFETQAGTGNNTDIYIRLDVDPHKQLYVEVSLRDITTNISEDRLTFGPYQVD